MICTIESHSLNQLSTTKTPIKTLLLPCHLTCLTQSSQLFLTIKQVFSTGHLTVFFVTLSHLDTSKAVLTTFDLHFLSRLQPNGERLL